MQPNHSSAGRLSIACASLLLCVGAALAQPGPGPGGPPPQLPPVPFPPQNTFSEAKRVLGKILFWDEQLSSDNTVACGTCHRPEIGGTDPRSGINPGIEGIFGDATDILGSPGVIRQDTNLKYEADPAFGLRLQVTRRTAQDFMGGAYHQSIFWDGRASSVFVDPDTGVVAIPAGGALETQSLMPLLSTAEMAHGGRTLADVVTKLQGVTPLKLATNVPPDMAAAVAAQGNYPGLFQAAFGSPTISARRIALAIATYERTLVPNQTPYDAFAAGNPAALTQNQHQGFMAFQGVGRCNACHTAPFFSDGTFRNIGLRPLQEDEGRFEVTANPADRGRFKVPSLRNAALRSRYFHNGQVPTLPGVLAFYNNSGGPFPANRDPVLQGLVMTPLEQSRIVDFLQALVDPRAAQGLFPFDRPTLHLERLNANSPFFGAPTAGTGGVAPQWIANSPPALGSTDFKVGVRDALGGANAWLGLSPTPASPMTNFGGVAFHLDFATTTLLPFVLGGTGPTGGYTTVPWAIPNIPSAVGIEIIGQWFVEDPNGASGFSASRGLRLTLF